jgi:hypothetical protein
MTTTSRKALRKKASKKLKYERHIENIDNSLKRGERSKARGFSY